MQQQRKFTENILHHQALGMFDKKFGENREMKVRKPHPSVDNITIFYLLIAIQEIILEPKL